MVNPGCNLLLQAIGCSIEMGRQLHMARVARVCTLCPGMHLGNERHCVFLCPAVVDIRRHDARLFDDSHRTMRLSMWHPNQKGVGISLIADS